MVSSSSPSDPLLYLSACTSEGVIAYYWSQFDVPVEDLAILPEFSEERVLDTLENGFKAMRSMASRNDVQISEITAAGRYLQGQVWGSHQEAER